MRRITPKQYARALHAALEEAPQEQERIIHNFVKMVHQRGDIGKIERVYTELQELQKAAEGVERANVLSAVPLDAQARTSVQQYVRERTGGEVELTESVTPHILSGVIVRYRDRVFDASARTMLRRLAARLRQPVATQQAPSA